MRRNRFIFKIFSFLTILSINIFISCADDINEYSGTGVLLSFPDSASRSALDEIKEKVNLFEYTIKGDFLSAPKIVSLKKGEGAQLVTLDAGKYSVSASAFFVNDDNESEKLAESVESVNFEVIPKEITTVTIRMKACGNSVPLPGGSDPEPEPDPDPEPVDGVISVTTWTDLVTKIEEASDVASETTVLRLENDMEVDSVIAFGSKNIVITTPENKTVTLSRSSAFIDAFFNVNGGTSDYTFELKAGENGKLVLDGKEVSAESAILNQVAQNLKVGKNVVFKDNKSSGSGGAIYFKTSDNTVYTVDFEGEITGCSAGIGSAIYAEGKVAYILNLNLKGGKIYGNNVVSSTNSSKCLVYTKNVYAAVSGTLILHNTTTSSCYAIRIDSNYGTVSISGRGAAVYETMLFPANMTSVPLVQGTTTQFTVNGADTNGSSSLDNITILGNYKGYIGSSLTAEELNAAF